ncbi:MAG: sugar phosphate isomerase/epimerase [Gemmataceae bacterium]|nr:sugar phosphate isomerase/epimerase [Gemmataceae bacterium]MCI0738211.1 sugar phosphate isomerase/epimerase [Gemmataceae bacterium]
MKLGIMASGIAALGWDKALAFCRRLGLEAIEIPIGVYPKHHLLDVTEVLGSATLRQKIKDDLARHGLELSAIGCAGNPVHPDPEQALRFEKAHDDAVRLAEHLGAPTVIGFSGCPGGAPGDRTPNWVTCPWPTEYAHILEYQWNEVLIPFWQRKAKEARAHGIQIAIEAHPGFAVYNPETLLKLRRHAGDNLGANFDPSHFFWQGIDVIEAARALGEAGAIFHMHAKDTGIDARNTRQNGCLDTKSYGDLAQRSWVFRTVGYGHGEDVWKRLISMLRCQGYDGVLSIEHEDSMMSFEEGFTKALAFLRGIVIKEPAGKAWWF